MLSHGIFPPLMFGAMILFSLVFQGMDGSRWIEHLLSNLPGGQTGFLIFINVFVFFLAFFLDFFEIAFIVIPLITPVAAKMGCSAEQIALNMQGGNGCGINLAIRPVVSFGSPEPLMR